MQQGERDGIWAWHRFNRLFNWLPLAALIEKKIICMHGGIGRSINHIEQIENIQRPITMDAGSIVLMDLLWLVSIFSYTSLTLASSYFLISVHACRSDPTENDSVEGLRPNARGPGLVTFGVSNLHFKSILRYFSLQMQHFGCWLNLLALILGSCHILIT